MIQNEFLGSDPSSSTTPSKSNNDSPKPQPPKIAEPNLQKQKIEARGQQARVKPVVKKEPLKHRKEVEDKEEDDDGNRKKLKSWGLGPGYNEKAALQEALKNSQSFSKPIPNSNNNNNKEVIVVDGIFLYYFYSFIYWGIV